MAADSIRTCESIIELSGVASITEQIAGAWIGAETNPACVDRLDSSCAKHRKNRGPICADDAKLMIQDSENLFSYGTLQMEPVQFAAFGRKLTGQPDALVGYRVELIATKDHEFDIRSGATQHRNLRYTGVASDLVEGTVFQVTKEELEQSDAYEPWDYQRVQIQLRSGAKAWVYLNSNA